MNETYDAIILGTGLKVGNFLAFLTYIPVAESWQHEQTSLTFANVEAPVH